MRFVQTVLLAFAIAACNMLMAHAARGENSVPARLAIYYGYPSLINESRGDVEKAARVFSGYDVVVLGDGLEFAEKRSGRYPQGDPAEHKKTWEIMAAVRKHTPTTLFYGYVCLGEIPWPEGQQTALSLKQLEERMRLWKQLGVNGIFLDEAGYDYAVVTRERQNFAVGRIHGMGMSAFMNAYFVDHLFSLGNDLANGAGKNPKHLAPLLDHRDAFLLESFEVKNGKYESSAAAEARVKQALGYRRKFGARLFATTTTTALQPFRPEQFSYSWWTARVYGLDGFSWGEPLFAAMNNMLPERQCPGKNRTLPAFERVSELHSDSTRVWSGAGTYVVIVDTTMHAVRITNNVGSEDGKVLPTLLSLPAKTSLLICDGATE